MVKLTYQIDGQEAQTEVLELEAALKRQHELAISKQKFTAHPQIDDTPEEAAADASDATSDKASSKSIFGSKKKR